MALVNALRWSRKSSIFSASLSCALLLALSIATKVQAEPAHVSAQAASVADNASLETHQLPVPTANVASMALVTPPPVASAASDKNFGSDLMGHQGVNRDSRSAGPALTSTYSEAKNEGGFAEKLVEVIGVAVTAIATAVLAYFTFTLASSTKRLWEEAATASQIATRSADAAKASVEIAEKGLAVAHRAYLLFNKTKAGPKFLTLNGAQHVTGYVISAEALNSGTTPAFQVAMASGCEVVAKGQMSNCQMVMGARGGVVAPHAECSTGFCSISIAELMRCYRNEVDIYYFARVEYREQFSPDIERYHQMCSRIEIMGNPSQHVEPGHASLIKFLSAGPNDLN